MNNEPRTIQEGEMFDPDDVRRGLLRPPESPHPRPEPPLDDQVENWDRIFDLDPDDPIRVRYLEGRDRYGSD